MRKLHYHRVDVFTDRAFGGNPLAVFTNGRGVPAETMQAIAKEFNLSETTFVLPPDDPRIRATVLAIADELSVDGLVLRYRTDETDDGLSGEEGAFAICSFWLVSALVEIGELERAHQLCEKLLSFASPLGLYAEEIDPHSGRHLGNFPQAFTHLALIDAALRLIAVEAPAT